MGSPVANVTATNNKPTPTAFCPQPPAPSIVAQPIQSVSPDQLNASSPLSPKSSPFQQAQSTIITPTSTSTSTALIQSETCTHSHPNALTPSSTSPIPLTSFPASTPPKPPVSPSMTPGTPGTPPTPPTSFPTTKTAATQTTPPKSAEPSQTHQTQPHCNTRNNNQPNMLERANAISPSEPNHPVRNNDGENKNLTQCCLQCAAHARQNEILRKRTARLTHRLQTVSETQRTHGQRILRAFYEQKVSAMNEEHRLGTANMLNRQKKCFEEELEVMESESRARESSLHSQLEEERTRLATTVSAFERERDALLEKTEETFSVIQRKLGQLHSRSTRLEREKVQLEQVLSERDHTIETLVTAAAANDAEKRRVDLMTKTSDDERVRKDCVIDALQTEVRGLRNRLSAEMEINTQLVQTIDTVEGRRTKDRSKHEEAISDCQVESQKEVEKLGRLIATVIQDFANSQSEVSTRSADGSVADVGREDAMQSESTGDGPI